MSRNRLASASSPYLRQHKDNPVDWQPWDEEAFEQAKREDKPIFLSIGYSSCHWCHVMEHESFENTEIARILNQNFVSIKVDREERPDVDETYMAAVQMSSGHGGWPMSLFLTPERKPFFAGTYFPAEDRGQYAGFRTITTQIASGWKTRKAELLKTADDFASALRQSMEMVAPESSGTLSASLIDAAVFQMKRRFDHKHGGFEGHPKFPPHQALSLLLYLAKNEGRKDCLEIATRTLDAMMLGGIHDHVCGGFHRYSTDEKWLLPHFEKMLYDNALMLKNYADGYSLTKNPDYKRVCDRLIDWLEREMRSADGMYFSALDADSEGEEGKFYTWTWEEAARVCSPEFLEAFQIRKEGNFDDEATGEPSGKNIPHLREAQGDKWDGELKGLLELRVKRGGPGLDDKVLVAWNGLAISGLAAAGCIDIACRIADAVLALDEVPHQVVGSKSEGKPFLDVAYFIEGLIDLAEKSGKEHYKEQARRIFELARQQFRDELKGGWFFSGTEHDELFGRSKSAFDSALPSPNGVIIRCALRLGYMDIGRQDLRAMLGWMERAPLATESLHLAAAKYLDYETRSIAPKVTFRLEPKEAHVTNGKAYYRLVISIPEGCHINSSRPPEDYLIPTSVDVSGFSYAKARIPETKEPLTGNVCIEISGEPPPGQEGEGKATITYQMCTERECQAPETKELSLGWHR